MTSFVRSETTSDSNKRISFPDIKDALHRVSRRERATTSILNAPSILQFWLWGCDANEICDRGKCDFHLMHLTGMVCTQIFLEAYRPEGDSLSSMPNVIDDEDITLLTKECDIFLPHFYDIASQYKSSFTEDNKPQVSEAVIKVPSSVTLQQLRDLVHAVQTQWPLMQTAIQSTRDPEEKLEFLQVVDRLVTQLFLWFGYYLFENNIPECKADDKEFVDTVPPTHALAMTEMGIKFYLNIFFVLFRLLFVQRHSITVPSGKANDAGCYPFSIETFHVEAGVDDFHLLGMYCDIPAGCLLEYKHSFSGYYNNVSQCVYRHFPSYKRRLPLTLSEVEHDEATDLSVLPSIKQIYPEIEFAFEDHHFYREVAGVKYAVLFSATPSHAVDIVCHKGGNGENPKKIHNNQKKNTRNNKISEKILQSLATCKDVSSGHGSTSGDSGGMDGGRNAKVGNWFWFTIGANIYLVHTVNSVIYSGSCKDLLAFYLSEINSNNDD